MSPEMCAVASIGITLTLQLSGFAMSFALQTEVFYDVVGGLNFMALAICSFCYRPDPSALNEDTRRTAHTLVFLCSRAWLLSFLAWRAHDRKGDVRFDGVIDKFWKFLLFWTVQGCWVFMISMPMLFVNSAAVRKSDFSTVDGIAIIGFAVGVIVEVAADVQKTLWIKAGRPGGFCAQGIWGFSRHPNYFGEILQWWCSWAFAFSSSAGVADLYWWACVLSPAFTMHVLLNIPATGVAQANGKNLKRYYEKPEVGHAYSEYRASTSILIPMMGYQYVPKLLKRTLFFDFAHYEYRPNIHSETKAD